MPTFLSLGNQSILSCKSTLRAIKKSLYQNALNLKNCPISNSSLSKMKCTRTKGYIWRNTNHNHLLSVRRYAFQKNCQVPIMILFKTHAGVHRLYILSYTNLLRSLPLWNAPQNMGLLRLHCCSYHITRQKSWLMSQT